MVSAVKVADRRRERRARGHTRRASRPRIEAARPPRISRPTTTSRAVARAVAAVAAAAAAEPLLDDERAEGLRHVEIRPWRLRRAPREVLPRPETFHAEHVDREDRVALHGAENIGAPERDLDHGVTVLAIDLR